MSLIDRVKGKAASMAMGTVMDFITPEMIDGVLVQVAANVQAQETAAGKHFVAVMEVLPDGRPAVNLYSRDTANQMHFEQAVNVPAIITQILTVIKNGNGIELPAVA